MKFLLLALLIGLVSCNEDDNPVRLTEKPNDSGTNDNTKPNPKPESDPSAKESATTPEVLSELSFSCDYKENDESTMTLEANFKLKDEKLVGTVTIDGDRSITFQEEALKIQFQPYLRKNENKFVYAKFSNKTSAQRKNKEWVYPFFRISIPKSVVKEGKTFSKKNPEKFRLFFAYHHSAEDKGFNPDSDFGVEDDPSVGLPKSTEVDSTVMNYINNVPCVVTKAVE